jgi:hypothetical protein
VHLGGGGVQSAFLFPFFFQADILVVAIGKQEFVRGSWVKPGAVVIDVGIHQVPDATKKSGFSYVGDVCFSEVCIFAFENRGPWEFGSLFVVACNLSACVVLRCPHSIDYSQCYDSSRRYLVW